MASAGAGAGAGGAAVPTPQTFYSNDCEPAGEFDFDLIVIGGGSGGLACSKRAVELGARVAVLDFVKPSPAGTTWGLGGTCVNVGCIPKKLFHAAALLGEARRHGEGFGWSSAADSTHDWTKLTDAIQDHISSLNFGYRVELRTKGVKYMNTYGSFLDAHTVECVDKRGKRSTVTGRRFVLAVGGRPRPLNIPGGDLAISSDDIFSLPKAPGRTLCVGASYVSLECAGFLAGLGYPTTVAVRSILLRGFDQEVADIIGKDMEKHGITMKRGVVPTSIVKQDDGSLLVTFKDSSTGEESTGVFDTVLSAIGRDAVTGGVALDKAGVEALPNGKVKAENEQTNVPHIYAIGDVLDGRPELTPVAIQAGRLLAERLYGGASTTMNYNLVPTTVFTPLEYGCIGLSEEDAKDSIGESNLDVYLLGFKPLEWNVSHHDASAFVKLICDKTRDGLVVGLHYVGPNAGEVTQGFAVGMRLGATYETFKSTVGIHPTCAEEFTTLSVTRASGEEFDKGGC